MQYLQSQVNISKFGHMCTIREERVGLCVGAEPDQMGRMKEEGSVYECMSVHVCHV